MKPNSYAHLRRTLRLKGYDYSQAGAYFITICTHKRKFSFGNLSNGKMRLNNNGQIASECWHSLPSRFRNILLDEYVFMPNHLHGIIIIVDAQFIAPDKENHAVAPQPTKEGEINRAPTLGKVIRTFKALASRRIRLSGSKKFGWQRNYYDHVIRNEDSLNKIRKYIITNPLRWELDRENPYRKGEDEFDCWIETFKTRPDVPFGTDRKR